MQLINPVNICLFKVKNRNIRNRFKFYKNNTRATLVTSFYYENNSDFFSTVFIVDFEQVFLFCRNLKICNDYRDVIRTY